MTQDGDFAGLELRSKLTSEGELQLFLAETIARDPGPDEIVVRIEAAPLNPSDLGVLFGPADLNKAVFEGRGSSATVKAPIPPARMAGIAARIDQSMAVGNEGAGIVVRTGDSTRHLLGRAVAVSSGGTYARFMTVKASDCMVLPSDVTPAQGASVFINPLTALGMTETMRREGHRALVHTAAASNLGQMLNKLCLKDGIGLVNIVRNPEQAALLREIGARHVCDSTADSFVNDLATAVEETGATLAFDAIGGGALATQILTAMETAASRSATEYSRYGSRTQKQVYIYGGLDLHPTMIERTFGMAWGVGGWLVMWLPYPFRRSATRRRWPNALSPATRTG